MPNKFPIAIVGVAFRLPGNLKNEKELWEALSNSQNMVTQIPEERWDLDKYHHPDKDNKGKSYTFAAGVLSDIYDFDASFFGISPREAQDMDPQQRMLLELTYEALENGGQNVDLLKGSKCAVYVGISGNEYSYNAVNDTAIMSPYSMTGGTNSIASNRISYTFDFHGPSVSVDTACSSSLVALHQACTAMWQGEADSAIVGGSNLLLNPMAFVGFSKASMLSPDGLCKSFDNDGKGYVRAEGGIIFYLKPLEQAEKDGDPVHAVIENTGINSDGKTSVLPLPDRDAQARLLEKLYAESKIKPNDVTYIEAHGTGTPVGDPIEVSAIGLALARKRKKGKLPIGSIKSNIGHMETAAGLGGALKTILCLKNKKIPATLHFSTPNKHIDFEGENIQVIAELTSLPEQAKPMIMGVNSFGFGGTNSHAVLKEYRPRQVKSQNVPEGLPPFILSAASKESLEQKAHHFADSLTGSNDDYHLAYGATFYAKRHDYTLAVDCKSSRQAKEALESYAKGKILDAAHILESKHIGLDEPLTLVYSGNGAQWAGMGQQLLAESEEIRGYFDKVAQLFKQYDGLDLVEVIQSTESNTYELTEVAQPALFALQVALTQYLVNHGLKYSAVIGHSIGEIAAAWAAGILSLEDAVKVVHVRSHAQGTTKGQGRMAAISVTPEHFQQIKGELNLKNKVEVAGFNSPKSITITGNIKHLSEVESYCSTHNIFFKLLDLDYSFHSRKMNSIKQCVLDELKAISPKKGHAAFISTVTGKTLPGEKLTAEYWWHNIRKPVCFQAGLEALVKQGKTAFLDIGPHPILAYYIKETLKAHKVQGTVFSTLTRDASAFNDLRSSLLGIMAPGLEFDWQQYYPIVGQKRRLSIYPWDKKYHHFSHSIEDLCASELFNEHPLLGWRQKKDESVWINHLDAQTCGYVYDHQVGKSVVMPASGFVDMALSAVQSWYGLEEFELKNFEIRAPLVLDDVLKETRLSLEPKSGQFTIESRNRLSDDEYTLHTKGRILAKPYTAFDCNSAALIDGVFEGKTTFSKNEHYKIATSIGLDYGDDFQLIEAIEVNYPFAKTYLDSNVLPDHDSQHVLHPEILDMCFQSLIPILYTQTESHGLRDAFLPIGAETIKLNGKQFADPSYIETVIIAHTERSIVANFSIFNASGECLAVAKHCRFKRAQLIKPETIPQQHRFIPYLLSGEAVDLQKYLPASNVTTDLNTKQSEAKKLIELYILQFLYESLKEIFDQKSFEECTLTLPQASKNFSIWALNQLNEYEWVAFSDGVYCWNEVEFDGSTAEIWQLILSDYPDQVASLVLMGQICSELPALITGQKELREVIDRSGNLYQHYFFQSYPALFLKQQFITFFEKVSNVQKPDVRLDILEIGSGLFSTGVIEQLPYEKGSYTLCGTDSTQKPKTQQKNIHYVALPENGDLLGLDILKSQQFDVILLSGLEEMPELYSSMVGIKQLLKPQGVMISGHYAPSVCEYLLHGFQEEWWSFENDNKEATPSALFSKQFSYVLSEGGLFLSNVSCLSADEDEVAYLAMSHKDKEVVKRALEPSEIQGKTLVVSDKETRGLLENCQFELAEYKDTKAWISSAVNLENINRLILLAPINLEMSHDVVLTELFESLKTYLINAQDSLEVILITQGGALCDNTDGISYSRRPLHSGLWGLFRVMMNELSHHQIKLIDCADTSAKIQHRLSHEILLSDFNEDEVILSQKGRFSLRLCEVGAGCTTNHPGQLLKLDFHQPGSFKYLDWFPLNQKPLGKHEVRVKPMASGLNFRDLMYTLGFVSDEAVENGFVGAAIGMEMAGEVTEVGGRVTKFRPGDKVMGLASACFSEQIQTTEGALTPLPQNWNYQEGATVGTAFFTAYYALMYLIRTRPAERVLIHGAAGGVGLAAIQIAKHLELEIYATAGSVEKRDLLRLLGVDNIYDSRTYQFADEILRDTGQQGVDIVLNSLAGEAIEANFKVLKPFGRFIELGKRDFYDNTQMGLRPFRNNISYFGVDVDQLMVEHADLTHKLFKEMVELFEDEVFKPLPYQVFDANDYQDAFRYMQQSKQVGKVVLDFSQGIEKKTEQFPQAKFAIDANGTYLVVGGTKGFGFESACFLIGKGARHIVLASRTGEVDESAKKRIQALQGQYSDLSIELKALDITNEKEVKETIKALSAAEKPLKGLIHAATLYDDHLMGEMSGDAFQKVLQPKVLGAQYLDKYTRALSLDFFILYSSVTTYFGNIGQANYVTANAYMEGLIYDRLQQGVPGIFVAWGPIADAGQLARKAELKQTLEQTTGTQAISTKMAMKAFDQILNSNLSGVAMMNFDADALGRVMPIFKAKKYELLPINASSSGTEDLAAYIKTLGSKEAIQYIASTIQNDIAKILCVSAEDVDITASLPDIGVDSLMGAEFAIAMEKNFAIKIPAMSLLQSQSIEHLSQVIYEKVMGEDKLEMSQQSVTLAQHGEVMDVA